MTSSIIKPNDDVGISRDHITGEKIQIKGSLKILRSIENLAQFGKITFSREQNFKSTHYTIHFFKPTSRLRDLYNLGNEVLILCCSDGMRDFKSRTKDFIDYILTTRAEFKNRLDKITCFFIDNNEQIVEIVKQDRLDNPDSRLIVPFCYSELQLKIDESIFQNRMRTFLYERDLFGIASPLNSDAYFFGKDRSNLISDLYSKYKQGEQGGLFGLRRIGKTSVLNLLKLRIKQDNGVAVYFDCSKYHHKRWNLFLEEIVNKVYSDYIIEPTEDGGLYLPKDFLLPKFETRYIEENATISFEEDMFKLYNALGQVSILLIFDEIENISYTTSPSSHWKEENDSLFFWQTLRSIIQTNNKIFSFIITGVNPKCVEISKINEYDNPIFGMLRPQYMSLFDLLDVKNMVSGIGGHLGLSFDDEIYTRLVDDYGGHPFLIRQVSSKINTGLLEKGVLRPTNITKYSYERYANDYKLEMSGVIEQILDVLSTYYIHEFDLLKKLALDGRSSFNKEIAIGETAISHLVGYCLIHKDNDEYFIRIKSIEDYLKNKYKYEITLNTPNDKRNRLNKRRDDLESKLRKIIFYNLNSKFGSKAKERLIQYITGTTTDKTQSKKIQDARFKDSMEELYFSQLKVIMLKDWKDYQNIFNDRIKFEQFFDLINSSRGAGDHNKAIDEEDEVIYSVAFKYFEKALQNY